MKHREEDMAKGHSSDSTILRFGCGDSIPESTTITLAPLLRRKR